MRLVSVSDPVTGFDPPQPPEALQLVAFVEDQLNVELPPLATVVGAALSVTVGGGGAVTVTMTD